MPEIAVADPVGALVPHTLQQQISGSGSGLLAGRTFKVKDLFAIEGRKVSNGNPDWYEAASPAKETAQAIRRLLAAGATLTGITICDEFFYSALGVNIHYGTPVNTQALRNVTGGSSCGSVRVPAAFCGLYGLRPTYGRIDVSGATPMAPSYDTVGFLARDSALFRAIGRVLLDGPRVDASLRRLIIAQDIISRSEASIVEEIWHVLDRIGSALPVPKHIDVAGEDFDDWRNAFRFNQGFEIQSTLMPFALSHADGLSPAIRERFEIAARIHAGGSKAGTRYCVEAKTRLLDLAKPGTMIVMPTTPTLPPERHILDGASTLKFRAMTLGSTCLAGHAGLPQISIPTANAAGCPVGISFIGWQGGDETLLDLAVKVASLLAHKA